MKSLSGSERLTDVALELGHDRLARWEQERESICVMSRYGIINQQAPSNKTK